MRTHTDDCVASCTLGCKHFTGVQELVEMLADVCPRPNRCELHNFIRVRKMLNAKFDARWHRLKVNDNFEITLEK